MLGRATVAFHLFTLSYYVKEFGIVEGPVRFTIDRWHHYLSPAGAVFKARAPHDGEIHVRARTNDLAVFIQTYILRGSDITRMAQYPALEKRYEDIIRRGKQPLVIDGGGHIGTVSVLLAHLFPQAKIVTIEPDPQNFEMARRNTANLSNVDLRRSALWFKPTIVNLSTETLATDAVSVSSADATASTAGSNCLMATTIDEIVAEFPNAELFLLKLDIEGAESAIITPQAQWLRSVPVTIVEPHDWMIAGNSSLRGLLAVPDYRNGDIVISGENLVFFPAAAPQLQAAKTTAPQPAKTDVG